MTTRTFVQAAFALLLSAVLTPCLQAENLAPAEKSKIETLIAHLEGLKDATFIRNGTNYDAKTAAKFLRGKWQANAAQIKSATDFIAVAATRSSTSGKPYIIRLKDSSDIPCADYLTAQLKKLETGKKQ